MRAWVLLLILLSATPTQSGFWGRRWIVWNVGQGQWVTRIEERRCLHFDMGGENFPWSRLKYFCHDKENQIFISHWDWDHIGAVAKFSRKYTSCLALGPIGKHRRQKLLATLAPCRTLPSWDVILGTPQKDSNAQSHVVSYRSWLIPGDSPANQEQRWLSLLKDRPHLKVLVLGHHGSRTSTSDALLRGLPSLQVAIASARWKRYRHPHPEVLSQLQSRRVPLLITEDWGHLHFLD